MTSKGVGCTGLSRQPSYFDARIEPDQEVSECEPREGWLVT